MKEGIHWNKNCATLILNLVMIAVVPISVIFNVENRRNCVSDHLRLHIDNAVPRLFLYMTGLLENTALTNFIVFLQNGSKLHFRSRLIIFNFTIYK
jgi:hypothetical protein